MAIIRVRLPIGPSGLPPMVPDYAAFRARIKRYLGMRFDASLPGFVATGETIELRTDSEFWSEYLRHMRDGDLVPADQTSALLSRIAFDPNASLVPAPADEQV